jgi:hypothetical protein
MGTLLSKFNLHNFTFSLIICLFFGCHSETANNTTEVSDTNTVQNSQNDSIDGFYDIPSPIQQVQLLQNAGATYDNTLLNSIDNVPNYSVTKTRALNLGVYGSDLSYAAVFNQSQDAIMYLTACKKLSESLGIKDDFYPEVMKRMTGMNGNKDSLIAVVSYIYKKSNESLKENDQSHISALVIVGSFIEGMYIGTQVAKTVKNKEAIYARIAQFKSSFNNLVALITTVHDSDSGDILTDLRTIKSIFDETSDSTLTQDQITRITKEVKAMRIKITNM